MTSSRSQYCKCCGLRLWELKEKIENWSQIPEEIINRRLSQRIGCPRCGGNYKSPSVGQNQCRRCGHIWNQTEDDRSDEYRYCNSCGSKIKAMSVMCEYCGTDLRAYLTKAMNCGKVSPDDVKKRISQGIGCPLCGGDYDEKSNKIFTQQGIDFSTFKKCKKCGNEWGHVGTLGHPAILAGEKRERVSDNFSKTNVRKNRHKKEWRFVSAKTSMSSNLVSLATLDKRVRSGKIKKADWVLEPGSIKRVRADQVPELVNAFRQPWPPKKQWLSRNGVLALAIFLTIALWALIYYSQFVRTVEVVSGHQTICKKCEKIFEDSRSVVRVRAIDRRKRRATTTWVLCKDCKQVEAIRAARVQDSLQRGFWIVLILIFIYLFARYPRFRNVVLICIGIKIVLWFLLSLSGTTRTCRHCKRSFPGTTTICKYCSRLLS